MSDKTEKKSEWVKMISRKELENRLKEAKALAVTAKEKIWIAEKSPIASEKYGLKLKNKGV